MSGLRREVKFRVTCEDCGERQPRATTAWTAQNWMVRHIREQHEDDA